jgi:PhzF family phenazine biosynthesis protein
MAIPIFQVDAFTDKPFGGNPAAVCFLKVMGEDSWMQNVAREINLSETAFLVPETDGYQLRWFTPGAEVALCGHATLASAHVLWEAGYLPAWEAARFHTKSGLLTCEREGTWIRMDFPATVAQPTQVPPALLGALGDPKVEFAGRSKHDYLLALPFAEAVRNLKPDLARLAQIPDVRGVIVTATADREEFDFISRFFAPAVGVSEDPVTGSAHCALTPYWAERLGKTEMAAWQASARGGRINVRFQGDRVQLKGQAVTVLRGNLLA